MARPLILFAFFLAAPAFSATLPEYDASFDAPPRLQAIREDDAVARVTGTDARYGVPSFLWSPRTQASTASGLVDFSAKAQEELARLAPFYGLVDAEVARLTPVRVHDTGSGAVIATFVQEVDGIEVFRDELKIAMDRAGNLVAASGFIPPASLRGGSGFTLTSSRAAARAWEDAMGTSAPDLGVPIAAAGGYERFELTGVRTKKVLFHLPSELVPAWYVEVAEYAYVVAAADGAILYRHALVANDSYGYRVWADGSAQHIPWDGPQGTSFSPHPTGIPDFTVPAFVPSTLLTLANGPIATNDPWLPPASTESVGNNVDAYVDRTAPDGFNAGDVRASTNVPGAFDYAYNLNAGASATTGQMMAAATQLFYTTNFLHDWFYGSGFNEASGNAQSNNFGRGGLGSDELRAEADDYLDVNNANMLTPADGGHPRMQMFTWQPAPNWTKIEVASPPGLAGIHDAGGAPGFGPQMFDFTAPVLVASSSTFGVTGSSNNVGIGSGAEWIAVSDLNLDGFPDFATANFLSQSVSVRFLDPLNGGFLGGTEIPLGTRPYTVESGDLNHDGFPDLVVANHDVGTVSLLKGAAGGTFVERFDLPSGATTTCARVVNMDNDLYDDIVTTNFGANSVRIIKSNGTFGAASTLDLPVGSGPNWVEIGDLNDDGRKDLFVANEISNDVSLLVDNGAGGYYPAFNIPVGVNPLTCALGDIDRDGDLDLLTANFGDNTISVLIHTPITLLLTDTYPAPDGPVTVRLADLNVDGAPDMLVCSSSGVASWRLGDGGGGFGSRVDQGVGTTPYGIQSADVTLDGKPDILTANYGSSNVTVLSGTANFSAFGCPGFLSNMTQKIALVDRGGPCPSFSGKALAMQAAGAVGVIIVDNVASATPPVLGGTSGGVTIPVLSLTQAEGAAFKAALVNGAVFARMRSVPSVTRSGALDNQLVAHEWGHYISNRLIGNANGLTNPMGGALGEGWGDFHGLFLTARAGDDFHGCYPWTSYAVQSDMQTNNAYYFGLRRVPYSTSFAHDPLTFQHIQLGVPLPAGPPYQFGMNGSANNEVHSAGEVWCTMLWECYVSLLDAMPFAQAQAKMKDLLVAGYKLTPNQPTLLEARDALLAAAFADDPANYVRFRLAFARRGAGAAATGPDRESEDFIPVVESYETVDVPGPGLGATLDFALRGSNPSSAGLEFAYTMPSRGRVTIAIYDVAGRVVATPLDEVKDAGPHTLRWNGGAAAGVYFARISAAGRHAVQRAVILP
jgi:hypothetical protein